MATTIADRLVDLRRELHRHPEPSWREFYTTCTIADEARRIGIDELHVGPEAHDTSHERWGVPDDAELCRWQERARAEGCNESILDTLEDGYTGAVAVLEQGDGPVVGVRVDIDALEVTEADDDTHRPAAEGFRSKYPETMHACGHDAHATIGLGLLMKIRESDFSGTLKVLFQPGEEDGAGGEPMAKSRHLNDIEWMFCIHVGLGFPTGTIVGNVLQPYYIDRFSAEITGQSAHAGDGGYNANNAVQAMATAVQNLHGIARHDEGATRINTGVVRGGSQVNNVPAEATIQGDVRGETMEVGLYVMDRARRIIHAAADMHGCEATFASKGSPPNPAIDRDLLEIVGNAVRDIDTVETYIPNVEQVRGEDAKYLMCAVQNLGGATTYLAVGSDLAGDHHEPNFDLDECSLTIGVEALANVVLAVLG